MRYALTILALTAAVAALAQPSMTMHRDVASLQVTEKRGTVDIDFDVMGHEYKRIVYKVEHWNADWSERSDLLESEYMEGFDGNPIDDYEESRATSVLYTHYHLRLPNDDVRVRLSGNYRVWLIDEESEDTLAAAGFMVCEDRLTATGAVTSRTDRDINGRHQQIELEVRFGSLPITDPEEELKVFVDQNRRWDTHQRLVNPNLRSHNSIGWSHRRELIYDAGNACHKFEITDKNRSAMGVASIEYVAPYEHAMLFPAERPDTRNDEKSMGGIFVIRNTHGDNDTEGEYRWVHFGLDIEPLPPDERAYIVGDLTQGRLLDDYELVWNDDLRLYECAALLKEGYYEYRIVHTRDKNRRASTWLTDGDFWETENDYNVTVYWRERGGRYDRLVGKFKLQSHK